MKNYLQGVLNYQVTEPSNLPAEKEQTLRHLPLVHQLSVRPYPQMLPKTLPPPSSLLNRIDHLPQQWSGNSIRLLNASERGKSLSPRQSNLSQQNLPSTSIKTNQAKTMHSSNTLSPSTPSSASLMSRLNVGPELPQDLVDTEEHREPLLLTRMKRAHPTSPPILIKESEGEMAMNQRT